MGMKITYVLVLGEFSQGLSDVGHDGDHGLLASPEELPVVSTGEGIDDGPDGRDGPSAQVIKVQHRLDGIQLHTVS